MPQKESDLIRRAQGGDDDAFEALVRAYQTRVYNLALRMSKNAEDAFDLTQETFIRIYKALSLFKGQSAFSTWVYSIASNVCIDFARRQKKHRERSVSLSDAGGEALDIPDVRFRPDTELERAELRRAIAAGLDSLSPEHREILVLREIWGLSYSEICEVLDLEAGTVKSRISRARVQLCVFLRNKAGENPSKEKEGR